MSAKTKIVVLHVKELIYAGIIAAFGILFLILLLIMFLPKHDSGQEEAPSGNAPGQEINTQDAGLSQDLNSLEDDRDLERLPNSASPKPSETVSGNGEKARETAYIPGVYTTSLVLNEQAVDIEVIVDKDSITSVRMVNLDEAIATMYPLVQPSLESLAAQIYEKQSLDDLSYPMESRYTSLVLINAIDTALQKAYAEPAQETLLP